MTPGPELREPPVGPPSSAEDPAPPEADAPVVLPTRDDPMIRGGLEGLGGPVGRRPRLESGWWTPLRVMLLVLGGSLVVGYLLKSPCRDAAVWADEYQFTHLCYTDTLASFTAYGLDLGQWPYFGYATPYPPLLGGFMALAAWLGGGLASLTGFDAGVAYWDVTVVMLAVCAVGLLITTAVLAGRRRPWDAMLLAASPVVVMHAFTNWDLLPAALMGAAMVVWAKRSPAWAGVLLGLAVVAKAYPAFLLVVLLLLCWRAGRWRAWAVVTATTAATVAAVVAPLRLIAPDNATAWWGDNVGRGPDWDSLWLPLAQAFGWEQDGATTNVRVLVVWALVLAAVAVLAWRAPRRPRVASLAFVLLAGLLVTSKVFSPHDALWLTPLAVLARPRWRAYLVWQATEVLLVMARMYLLVGRDVPDKGLPIGYWYAAVAVRDVALLVLVGLVVREILRPRHDVVRADGVDDPAGGVLDGAPDARPRADEPADAGRGGTHRRRVMADG